GAGRRRGPTTGPGGGGEGVRGARAQPGAGRAAPAPGAGGPALVPRARRHRGSDAGRRGDQPRPGDGGDGPPTARRRRSPPGAAGGPERNGQPGSDGRLTATPDPGCVQPGRVGTYVR